MDPEAWPASTVEFDVRSCRWADGRPSIASLLPSAKCPSTVSSSFLLAERPLMSAGMGGKSVSAGAPGCLRQRASRTSSVTSKMVSSDAITHKAADTSPGDNYLWTRDRRDCVGDMLETWDIVGEWRSMREARNIISIDYCVRWMPEMLTNRDRVMTHQAQQTRTTVVWTS